MSFYEDLVMQTQMNYSQYYHVYASGGTPYQLADKKPLPYRERITRLVQEIKDADCVVVGGASGLSAAGGGDFYYEDNASFRKYFGKFAEKYHFKGAFDGMFRQWDDRAAFWAYLATFLHTTQTAPVRQPYLDLDSLLKGKDFFVLTTNQDTQFVKLYPENKVAEIQGDHRFFQCAACCTDDTWDAVKPVEEMIEAMGDGITIPAELIPRCPHCGGEAFPWVRGYGNFLQGKKYEEQYEKIFRAAKESHVIEVNPTLHLNAKGGGIPQEDRQALTDEQVEQLLDAIRDLPPYVFVMIGLYAGLRREEILALQWDSVYLDAEAPYLTVRRAWHTEHNRPVILTELKTKAAERNIPLPTCLAECLREAKKTSTSDYVVANRDGGPLSYTQFKRLWQYIVTRTARPRVAKKLVDGKYVKYILYPQLGEKARNNGHCVYSLDFEVTPHQLRHTYITNLIHSSVDPKTVQYLAGHESSKITMDIYAKVKYNQPDQVVKAMDGAFAQWDTMWA